jgi:hypothetical protein
MGAIGGLLPEEPIMNLVHIIVAKARHGWGVSVDSDQVSLHKTLDSARSNAAQLGDAAERLGESAVILDLSEDDEPEA